MISRGWAVSRVLVYCGRPVVHQSAVRRSSAMAQAAVKDTILYCSTWNEMRLCVLRHQHTHHTAWDNKPQWEAALQDAGIPLQATAPDGSVPNPEHIRFAIVWNPPTGYLDQVTRFGGEIPHTITIPCHQFPNLAAVQSAGAGVDGLLQDPSTVPPTMPLVRARAANNTIPIRVVLHIVSDSTMPAAVLPTSSALWTH